MKDLKTPFQPPIRAQFFTGINVSVTIAECAENRRLCMAQMTGDEDTPLATPYQEHTGDCAVIDFKPSTAPVADAYVTKTPDLAIGVLTADCAPILFAATDDKGIPIIGAAHAGARGALRGIVASTVKAMRGLGANVIAAAIGPCIHQDSYEVGSEFYEEFTAKDPDTESFFRPEGGKWRFDLPGYCGHLLEKEDVGHTLVPVDTYSDPGSFSYRRATHRGEPDYGRQLSAIMISSARR